MFDITILTESRYENIVPTADDWYVQNILMEDGLVQKALEKHGCRVQRVDWARPDMDWSQTKAVLFRSTWDYFHRFDKFNTWLNKVRQQTKLINPANLIRWNVDKHYLLDMQQKGITIPPTRYIHKGEQITLAQLHRQMNWTETVLKPTVSGAARHTYRLHTNDLNKYEAIFQQLIAQEDMMLQPFQHHILTKGEVALMVMNGKFTHSILKKAKVGDFRVQDDFGGTVHLYQASPAEIAFAEKAVAACHPLPLYARVDVIWDNNNQLALSELELIEPELWFRWHPEAADVLAEGIVKYLRNV